MVFLPVRRKEKESKKNLKNSRVDVSAKTGRWGVSLRVLEEGGGFRASRPVPPRTSISSLLRLSALQTELGLLKSSLILMVLALVPSKCLSQDGERLGSSAVASAWLSWVLCPWP